MEGHQAQPLTLLLLGSLAMLLLAVAIVIIVLYASKQKQKLKHQHEIDFLNYTLEIQNQTQARLELEIAARTAELEEAQRSLLEQEKLHALGLLLQNLGHELNSPLSAVKSSLGTVKLLVERLPVWQALEQQLSPVSLNEYLAVATGNLRAVPRKQMQERVYATAQYLHDQGYPQPEHWANELVGLGFMPHELTRGDFPLLQGGPQGLESALTLCHISRCLHNLKEANGLAVEVVHSFQRLSAQREVRHLKPIVVNEALATAVAMLPPGYQHLVKLEMKAQGSPEVVGDHELFIQLWYQLVRNGLEATGYKQEVVLTLTHEPPNIKVVVEDRGPGIPSDVLPRVTEAFFTTRKEGQNLGMGLYLVKQVVKDLNGTLNIATGASGTQVVVQWPLEVGEGLIPGTGLARIDEH